MFGSYNHYCQISGLQAKGKNNFSADLIELCQQTLGWGDVEYKNDGQKRVIYGLKLRTNGDTTPTTEDSLMNDSLSDGLSERSSDNPPDDLKANVSNSYSETLTTLPTQSSSQLSGKESEKNQIIDRNVANGDPFAKKPKTGDRVQYIGTKFREGRQPYNNLTLVIHRVDAAYNVADCRMPDGGFTTWIPLEDLIPVDSTLPNQGGNNA